MQLLTTFLNSSKLDQKSYQFFLDIVRISLRFYNVVWITTEKALIWYITQPCPMVICDSWVCKKKLKHTRIQCFSLFSMIGTTRVAGYCASSAKCPDHGLQIFFSFSCIRISVSPNNFQFATFLEKCGEKRGWFALCLSQQTRYKTRNWTSTKYA